MINKGITMYENKTEKSDRIVNIINNATAIFGPFEPSDFRDYVIVSDGKYYELGIGRQSASMSNLNNAGAICGHAFAVAQGTTEMNQVFVALQKTRKFLELLNKMSQLYCSKATSSEYNFRSGSDAYFHEYSFVFTESDLHVRAAHLTKGGKKEIDEDFWLRGLLPKHVASIKMMLIKCNQASALSYGYLNQQSR